MDDATLYKKASETISTLNTANIELQKQLSGLKEAIPVAIDLYKSGACTLDNLETKITELSIVTSTELSMVKQASKIAIQTNSQSQLFKLSSDSGIDQRTPEDKLIAFLME